MGAFESTDNYELAPPPPSRSTLFVVRNGRYEPQNLMPILPRSDMLDFDGFVVRRGMGQGCLSARPPEMRQANLVKNPLSVRRDSARVCSPGEAARLGEAGGPGDAGKQPEVVGPTAAMEAAAAGPAPPGAARPASQSSQVEPGSFDGGGGGGAGAEDGCPSFSFVFDAIRPGTLSVHLLMTEAEVGVDGEIIESAGDKKGERKVNKGPIYIRLTRRQEGDEKNSPQDGPGLPPYPAPTNAFDERPVATGLGQVYQSPPLDLERWPLASLCFDPTRPRDVPIAVRLETDLTGNESPIVQYTYISLQAVPGSPVVHGPCDTPPRPQWSAQIYSQKLQYDSQCFVLHEVFGVSSKLSLDTEVEGGSSDCVICLCEPRDTAVLPCRHMCFCSYCAGIVRLQCDRCPVCRQKVQSLLQFRREPELAQHDATEGGSGGHRKGSSTGGDDGHAKPLPVMSSASDYIDSASDDVFLQNAAPSHGSASDGAS